ncbi:EpsG family protein [Lachnospiraceae bacterium A10]|nr:EpsG family protein [Lachnospiraceae bacterium A10]
MDEIESLLIYLIVAFIATFFFSLYKSKKLILKEIGLLLSVVIPSIIAGIRYNVGTDYNNYYASFEQLKDVNYFWILKDDVHFNLDRGFLLISKIFVDFSNNSRIVFFLWSLTILVLFIFTVYSYRYDYDITLIFFVFLLLYYYTSFNILRQIVAVCIIFRSIKYVFDNKLSKFLILVGIASTIHITAVLSIPLWFLWNHKTNEPISKKRRRCILVFAVLFVTLWQYVLRFFAIFNISIVTKYMVYLNGNKYSNISFIIKLGLTVVFIIFQSLIKREDKKIDFFILVFIISMLIEYVGFYSSYVKRISLYYSIVEVILISRLQLIVKMESRKLMRLMVVLSIVTYFVVGAYMLRQGNLIPFTV